MRAARPPSGLKLADPEDNNAIILTTPVQSIMHSAVDSLDKKHFVIITASPIGVSYCHLFSVKEKAAEIPKTISKFFQTVAAQEAQKSQSGSCLIALCMQDCAHLRAAASPAPFQNSQVVEQITPNSKTFDASYLGSDPVSANSQEGVAESAINISEMRKRMLVCRRRSAAAALTLSQATRQSRKQKVRNPDGDLVTIIISPDHVRTVDRMSGLPAVAQQLPL